MTDVLLIDSNHERREKNKETLVEGGFSVRVFEPDADNTEALPQNLESETCVVALSDALADAFTGLSKQHPVVVLGDPGDELGGFRLFVPLGSGHGIRGTRVQ